MNIPPFDSEAGEPTVLIYGAYGYTGTLVAEEAVRRGMHPVLGGRSEARLKPLADRLGLSYEAFSLDDSTRLEKACGNVDLVFHAAGPFARTAGPMVHACLSTGTHYLDIAGEIPVFERNFSLDGKARKRGVALISGVGFDVVPTDCLAAHVAARVDNPEHLEIAFLGTGGFSAGSLKTILMHIHRPTLIRKDGHLQVDSKARGIPIRFPDRVHFGFPITWGDLATAYHSTGIPTIRTFMASSRSKTLLLRAALPLARRIFALQPLRRAAVRFVGDHLSGPDGNVRLRTKAYVWARARNRRDQTAEAWLEIPESYRFTAIAGVECMRRLLAGHYEGALTPSQAFGKDFVLELPETKRFDEIT